MVANLFHTVNSELSKGSLPTALRRVMKEKFSSFDEYQLAKYNKSIKVEHKGNQIIVIIILLKSEQIITKIYSYTYIPQKFSDKSLQWVDPKLVLLNINRWEELAFNFKQWTHAVS